MSYKDLGRGILGGALVVVIVVVFFSEIVAVGLAPQPGDWLYPAWSSLTSIGFEALLLSVTGVAAVGLYLIKESGM